MRRRSARALVLATFFGTGLFAAPNAVADSGLYGDISNPGSPMVPYYKPPGYIGYYPGTYGLQSVFQWNPHRLVDAAGVGAMTNADPESAGIGMPGDRLGVQLQRPAPGRQEAGPEGEWHGVRPIPPMQDTTAPGYAGGVMPGATSSTGASDRATGKAKGLEPPTGQVSSTGSVPVLEARQPVDGPDTAN